MILPRAPHTLATILAAQPWSSMLIVDFAEKPGLAGLALEGSRLRLAEASRPPLGAASSAPPSFSPEDGFSPESLLRFDPTCLLPSLAGAVFCVPGA